MMGGMGSPQANMMAGGNSGTVGGGPSSLIAFQKNNLTATFAYSKDANNPSVTLIEATFVNGNGFAVENLNFQVAVPKYMKLQMSPASSSVVPAMGGGKTTQAFKVANSMHGQKPVLLRIKIDYTANGQPVSETGQVDSFPPNY